LEATEEKHCAQTPRSGASFLSQIVLMRKTVLLRFSFVAKRPYSPLSFALAYAYIPQ
jgi:hypothetical protein